MILRNTCIHFLLACALFAHVALPAESTEVQDLARLKGHEKNVLTGLGLVIGLNGTGDKGKDSYIAARPMARLLTNLGSGVASLEELAAADAFAIVQVTMEIPATGAREGDEIDVFVDALYNAKNLEGGRLVPSMLRLPLPDSANLRPLAVAQGRIVVEGDNPRGGVIRGGGQVFEYPDANFRTNVLTPDGTICLILHDQYAGHANASIIAEAINEEFAPLGHAKLARVLDARNILINVPAEERAEAASFVATVMTIPLDPALLRIPARVVVNESIGSIVITGDVEISPVAITHEGLSITTIAPISAGTDSSPIALPTTDWAMLDTTTTGHSARLEDLVRAFDQLNVPAKDRISILYALKEAGALHAEIITQ